MEVQPYWEAIQARICTKCLDADAEGNCKLPVGEECALRSFLPQVIMTVATVKSDSMEPYIDALRKNVCVLCEHEQPDKTCGKRNHLECALDRYYPILVAIIETVRTQMQRTEQDLAR